MNLPNQILVLPALSQTSNLQEKGPVILQHVVNLSQERAEMSNTNVLGHFQTGDLVVLSRWDGNITVIHAENTGLLLWNTSLAKPIVTPFGLVAPESDTSGMSAVVDGGILGKGSPAASNIKQTFSLLQVDLLTNDLKLIVLNLLKSLLPSDVGNDTGSVDHARSKEPSVKVITSVVVVTDLFFICKIISYMQNSLGALLSLGAIFLP